MAEIKIKENGHRYHEKMKYDFYYLEITEQSFLNVVNGRMPLGQLNRFCRLCLPEQAANLFLGAGVFRNDGKFYLQLKLGGIWNDFYGESES